MAEPVLLNAEIEGMTVGKIKAHPRERNLRISGLREDLVRRLKANVLEHENIDGCFSLKLARAKRRSVGVQISKTVPLEVLVAWAMFTTRFESLRFRLPSRHSSFKFAEILPTDFKCH